MAWTKTQLLNFWNTYINTNGAQAITGSLLNEGGTEIINAMALADEGIPAWYEPTHTGTTSTITLTQFSPTEVTVGEGEGYIIDSYSIPEEPDATPVVWFEQTVTVSDGTETGAKYIFIDATGVAVVGALTPQLRRTQILIGACWVVNGVIDFIAQIPDVINNTANDLIDYVSFFDLKSKTQGAEVFDVTAAPSIWHGTGEIFILGGNRANNPANPNIVALPMLGSDTVPYEFDVILSDGTVHETAQTVIPDYYDNGDGTVTNLPNNNATIFYVYRTLGGVVVLQPSQISYSGGGEGAATALQADLSVLEAFPASGSFILQAQIWWQESSPNFDDPLLAGISNITGAAGGSSSSGGGGGTTDYISGGSFNTSNGTLSLTGVGLAGASVALDGRYALSGAVDNYNKWIVGANGVYNDVLTSEIVEFLSGTGIEIVRAEGAGFVRYTFNVQGVLTDELGKTSGADPTAAFLEHKIKAGANITVTEVIDAGPTGNWLEIAVTGITGGQWDVITGGISYNSGKVVIGAAVVYTESFAVQGDARTTGYHRVGRLEVDGSVETAIKEVTGSYTVDTATDHTILAYTTNTITLPTAGSSAEGKTIVIKKTLSGSPTSVAGTLFTVSPVSSLELTLVGHSVTFQCGYVNGTRRWCLIAEYKPE